MTRVSGVLHLVAATLRADADPQAVDRAADLARSLSHADGARAVLVGRSEERLAVATWLHDREALEPFAASEPHMRFAVRGLPSISAAVWTAAVETDAPPLPAEAFWAFALHAPDGVYEWQVRQLLDDVAALPGVAAAGPTIEEHERFRAAGLVCLTGEQAEAFAQALPAARSRWGALAGGIEEASVPVLR